jgi:hypothetical protein
VEVSLLLLAEAGVADADVHFVGGATEQRQDATAWVAGVNAGIAVDRVLAGGLSLRVASPLLGASYTWERLDEPGQPRREGSGLHASALLAPRLELRLAF